MAKIQFGSRKLTPPHHRIGCLVLALTVAALGCSSAAWAQIVSESSGAVPAIPSLTARIGPAQIGLVINTADPYSVAVGAHYQRARRLAPEQVLQVDLPLGAQLSVENFERLRAAIASHFGSRIQALALAWVTPYAVGCNALTGALVLGYDEGLCQNSCRPSRVSPLFNSPSGQPWSDLRVRPAMHLAAATPATARALIDRGVRADGSLARRGAATVRARLLTTSDAARNVRARLYPSPGLVRRPGLMIEVEPAEAQAGPAAEPSGSPVLLLQTGQAQVGSLPRQRWVAGALADHFTSYGGQLDAPGDGQSSALAWIEGGATASHGSASEPCAHLQKFPHPQVLLGHYLQGATAIEAYWKSVAWPQQSVFIGEPLAAPFSARRAP